MKTKSATIYLIDDDESVRDAVGAIAKSGGYRYAAFPTGQEFLQAYDPEALGCLVLDVRLPNGDGLELQKQLTEKEIHIPVLIVSGYADVPTTVRAVKQGALDVLEKPLNGKLFLERVEEALKQHRKIRKWELERKEVTSREETLTPREREVYAKMGEGKPNKVIAEEMGISHKTLDIHRANVMRKMSAKTTGQIVRMNFLSASKPTNGK